jgi:hypothetical protein
VTFAKISTASAGALNLNLRLPIPISKMPDYTIPQILRLLETHSQRATYGALGNVVGQPARSVMNGLERNPLHSWIVRKSDGQPTGYQQVEKHPDLTRRPAILSDGAQLAAWLSDPK